MTSKRGRFVTIEGGEGVGKSLFIRKLADLLAQKNLALTITREPGGTPVADQIRQIFANPPGDEVLTAATEALLVNAARSQHVHKFIKPALAAGTWVISDRYVDSTRVYQGSLGGVGLPQLEDLIAFATGGLQPDLTFLLDCPVEVAQERLQKRSGENQDGPGRYDEAQKTVHMHIRQGFLELAKRNPSRIVTLDATKSPEALVDDACAQIVQRFGEPG